MRIVFSKDRPAQLDLLLRSLDRNAPTESTTAIVACSTWDYCAGYSLLAEQYVDVLWRHEAAGPTFHTLLAVTLDEAGNFVTFLCDDDVLYRPINGLPQILLRVDPDVLTFSLRLGGKSPWKWAILPPHDHGYPGSIDGHVFRTADLARMLDGQTIDNPLELETVLALRVLELAEERPLMACYREQALVGIDVNSVAAQDGRPHGKVYPQSAAELNERFLVGDRIALDALDFSGVDGCLVELPFVWERAA